MMSLESYELDPCSIDGSDQEVTLDNWKPSVKTEKILKSEWRQKQNNGNYNQQSGIDELKKINMYLKRKCPDHQIIDYFGINCETLVAIKRKCYSPVDGIHLDNQNKIYKEFNSIHRKIERFLNAFMFLSENLFDDKGFENF